MTPTSGAADLPEALRLAAAISNLLCSNEAAARTLAAAADELVRIHAESEMRRTALLDEMQKAALAAGQATAAQPVVPAEWPTNEMIDAGRKAAASQGRLLGSGQSLWHVFRAMLAAAPAQPAAQQGAAYAALPDEREMLKHALWLASSFTVHRYMMSCAEGRWSGAEKATCHDELCCLYVAVFRGVGVDQVRVDFEEDWVAVHDATQELTDHMDVVIGFPLKGVPDYEALAPKFFAYFHRLATHAIRASHGQAPAQHTGPCVVCGSDEPFTGTCGSRDPRALCKQPTTTAQSADSVPAPAPPPECETEAEKRAFAFGWFKALESERMKADSVQEDAARYRWLREGNDAKHGAALHVAVNLYGCEWDAAIDAARKKGEKQ